MDSSRLCKAFLGLNDLIKRLRGPDGCPWDRQQTDSSIKMYIIEEAYEVLDAIEKEDPDHICQELGDLIFQIMFLADMAEEEGRFGIAEVLEGIREKMIARHPHVFGGARLETPEEVSQNWAKIKERERPGNDKASSALESIPQSLPALMRAHRLTERASRFFKEETEEKWAKVEEALGGLKKAVEGKGERDMADSLGLLLFRLSDLARHLGLNAEEALRRANLRFLKDMRGG
ncbi:MAG: nucleoside triphosphate pyrophosphohydrolase [Deltaproteobacteria bacterium]|nr:nucleoside triphosphate pyrophosphohydrolase [Deltaproteobacteria bacterium]MBW2137044.1 nucleoside triphosphate pyrophosphohydrolase [Deltaproteobacteria bacterium]